METFNITVRPRLTFGLMINNDPVGLPGPQGPQGTAGSGVTILGSVATSTSLPGYPTSYTGDNNDSYIASDTGHLWVWDGDSWNDVGEIRGPQGSQGVQGTQGYQGARGYQGYQGVQGNQGVQGVQGSQGAQGSQGLRGYQGYQGYQGNPSTVAGPQGFQGVAGATWHYTSDPTPATSTGVVGDYALSTYGGTSNIWRKTGSSSWTWVSNINGPQGNQGAAGVQGVQGPRGYQGYQGAPGSDASCAWTDAGTFLYPTNGERISIGKTTNVGNTVEVTGNISYTDFLGMNCYYNSGWKFMGAGYAMMMKQEGTSFVIYVSTTSGSAGGAITWKSMSIANASGNVTAKDFVLSG